ncbi:Methyltransferase domain protein [compost metagenome]
MINPQSTAVCKKFEEHIAISIANKTLVKITMGNYRGNDPELKNLYIKPVLIKREEKLTFNYRYKTRDIFKNYSFEEGLALLYDFLKTGFKVATLFTINEEYIFEQHKQATLRTKALTVLREPDLAHDREKMRRIKANGQAYLQALKITDAEGQVFKNAQDKYRQINQYIEILHSLIKELPKEKLQQVVDMGSGKGYLTFALYDYLQQQLNREIKVTGVEYREDLVNLCNTIALRSDFNQLKFIQGTIDAYVVDRIDILIALHACDTATDDAIAKGIEAGAELIVVAPCCHKQIRKEIEKHKVKNEVSFLTRYGIFMERQAEMVTDGIRAMILEYFGYKTKVFEFISDAHTPKNILVVGIKETMPKEQEKKTLLSGIKAAKDYFGIAYHHLERLMKL